MAVRTFWAVAAVVFALDQGAKALVQRAIDPGRDVELVGAWLRLTHVYNPGGAFGIFGGQPVLVLTVTLLAAAAVVAYLPRIIRAGYALPVALLFGGALGNLADRLRYGKVLDFIDCGFWPVFNPADIAITAGAVLLGVQVLRGERNARGERNGHP
jgi:signal peptidase II